jgi:hypothetical protein
MKKPEYLVAFVFFAIGLFVFNVDNAYKFGRYSIQAIFYLGIALLIYKSATKKKPPPK